MYPTKDQLLRLGMNQFISQLFFTPIASYVGYNIIFRYLLQPFDDTVPNSQTVFNHILIFIVTNDVCFYVVHRLLHTKVLYQRIHKQHHEFIGTVGYAAEYAHPIEGLLGNQIPTISGLFIVVSSSKTHPLVLFVYIGIRLQQTYEGHSGYCFFCNTKGILGRILRLVFTKNYENAHHDFHHAYNQGNFGSFYMDYIFGTMDHYQQMNGYDGYIQLKKTTTTRSSSSSLLLSSSKKSKLI